MNESGISGSIKFNAISLNECVYKEANIFSNSCLYYSRSRLCALRRERVWVHVCECVCVLRWCSLAQYSCVPWEKFQLKSVRTLQCEWATDIIWNNNENWTNDDDGVVVDESMHIGIDVAYKIGQSSIMVCYCSHLQFNFQPLVPLCFPFATAIHESIVFNETQFPLNNKFQRNLLKTDPFASLQSWFIKMKRFIAKEPWKTVSNLL